MKVHVTRDLVGYALQQSNTNCAIALALKNADQNIIFPKVTQTKISYTDRSTGQRYTFDTPEKLAKWIDRFDRGESPAPINFEVNPELATKVRPIRRLQPSSLAHEAKQRKEQKVVRPSVPRSERPLREV